MICDTVIYADDTTLYSKYHQASHLWQQLELAHEHDLINKKLDWGKKRLVDFSAGKTQLVLFDKSNNVDSEN